MKLESTRNSWLFLADMVEFMKNLARMDVDMSAEERHLFSVGFKNTIGARRASWRILSSLEQKVTADDQASRMINAYRKKIEDELRMVCNEILSIIAIHCLPLANTGENVVFFYKMYVQVHKFSSFFHNHVLLFSCWSIFQSAHLEYFLLCICMLTWYLYICMFSFVHNSLQNSNYYRKGDYYRYLAEFSTETEKKSAADQSLMAYQVQNHSTRA